jgi:hypothetical protein
MSNHFGKDLTVSFQNTTKDLSIQPSNSIFWNIYKRNKHVYANKDEYVGWGHGSSSRMLV